MILRAISGHVIFLCMLICVLDGIIWQLSLSSWPHFTCIIEGVDLAVWNYKGPKQDTACQH